MTVWGTFCGPVVNPTIQNTCNVVLWAKFPKSWSCATFCASKKFFMQDIDKTKKTPGRIHLGTPHLKGFDRKPNRTRDILKYVWWCSIYRKRGVFGKFKCSKWAIMSIFHQFFGWNLRFFTKYWFLSIGNDAKCCETPFGKSQSVWMAFESLISLKNYPIRIIPSGHTAGYIW